jgi:CMP-N-acetylneuraminic acid synthetase
MKYLIVIPARGGSKGIPQKNIRFLNSKPLISYVLKTAISLGKDFEVVVSTDNLEISHIASLYGVQIINRPSNLADDNSTLDPVINHAVIEMEMKNKRLYDCVITIQPTSPLLTNKSLIDAIKFFESNNLDTVISVVNKPHLSWTEKNGKIFKNYEQRLNRQLLPKNYLETGAFLITKRTFVTSSNRIGDNVSIFELSEKEAIDIDSPQDWWIAEKFLRKKNIIIR